MMRGCKGMKSTSFQLPSSSTFCVGSLHFLCFDAKADAIPADRGPHSKEGSIISIASLICHHFSRKLGAWKPHEDAYLLVLDVIVQLKSEQTMNRLQAATGKDHIKNTNLTGKSCAMVIVWRIEYDMHQTLLTWCEFVRDSWAGWSWPETHCWSLRLPLSPFGQFVQLRSTFIPCLHVLVAHDLTCTAGIRRSSWAVLWLHEHSEFLGTETVKKHGRLRHAEWHIDKAWLACPLPTRVVTQLHQAMDLSTLCRNFVLLCDFHDDFVKSESAWVSWTCDTIWVFPYYTVVLNLPKWGDNLNLPFFLHSTSLWSFWD